MTECVLMFYENKASNVFLKRHIIPYHHVLVFTSTNNYIKRKCIIFKCRGSDTSRENRTKKWINVQKVEI